MNPWGRWIMIAALGGAMTEIDLGQFFRKRIRLIGSTLRSRTDEMKSQILKELQEKIYPVFESGKIKPVIYATFPLKQADDALQILVERKNIGNIVLTVK